jgi:hypothetical protein
MHSVGRRRGYACASWEYSCRQHDTKTKRGRVCCVGGCWPWQVSVELSLLSYQGPELSREL